jgi:ketosteroid isomerase-like protein
MSQENVEIFSRGTEAYNARNVEAFLELAHPDVEWHPAALQALTGAEAGVYRQHDGMRRMFREVDESLAVAEIEWSEIRDLGERIVAIGRLRTCGRGSGAETDTPVGAVVDFADEKVLRVQSYFDPATALEAVGLPE